MNGQKQLNTIILIILFFSLLAFGQYNSLRIWLCNSTGLLNSADGDKGLIKAKSTGYNYVMVEFWQPHTAEVFRDAFRKVNSYGMRLIPSVQLGSQHSIGWESFPGQQIDWNMVTINGKTYKCPSLVEDNSSNGFDACFKQFLQAVRNGYNQAGLSYPLEYIHLGHDELNLYETNQLLINCGSKLDEAFLGNFTLNNTDISPVIQQLLSTEIYRRIKQVQEVLNNNISPFTKVLIWGDQWDPEHNGGYFKIIFNVKVCYNIVFGNCLPCNSCSPFCTERFENKIATLSPGILSLPGLTDAQKSELKSNLILQPWSYGEEGGAPGDFYNAQNTFNQFTAYGFKFGSVSSIVAVDPNNYQEQIRQSFSMMHNYINASRNFKSNFTGYTAAQWLDWQQYWSGSPNYKDPYAMIDSLYFNHLGYIPVFNQITTVLKPIILK